MLMSKFFIFTKNNDYDNYVKEYKININYVDENNFSENLELIENNSIVFTDLFISKKDLLWINNNNIDSNNLINKILLKKNIKLIKILNVSNQIYTLFEAIFFLYSLKNDTNFFNNKIDVTNNLLKNKDIIVCGNGNKCDSSLINSFDLKFTMNSFFVKESKIRADHIKITNDNDNDNKRIKESNIIWYMGSFKVQNNLNYCQNNNIKILSKQQIFSSKISNYNIKDNLFYIKENTLEDKIINFFNIGRTIFTGLFLTVILLSNKLNINFFLSITGISIDLEKDYISERNIDGVDYVVWTYDNHEQWFKKQNLHAADGIEIETSKNNKIKYFFNILIDNEIIKTYT